MFNFDRDELGTNTTTIQVQLPSSSSDEIVINNTFILVMVSTILFTMKLYMSILAIHICIRNIICHSIQI